MKAKGIWLAIFIFIIGVITGCNQKAEPVAIDEKNDKCDFCHMAVGNNQFATELVLKNGKVLKFDDIGCMYQWMKEHKNETVEAMFVRDYETNDWLEADQATYVYDQTIRTPMAYNVISFKDEDKAKKFVEQHGGAVLTYNELGRHTWERNKEMMMEMKKEHMKMEKQKGDHMGN
ncbi:nitrous oxide reductase accessory protein NosL [Geobacillus jurassicus]|uniref:Nitrous oxide reductase accessory protein NosL n=1 Tax=Geobacillus jurassicus TaxID=235932 RepID=A0ABV6GSE0_9BACL|nr:nitrous oxide reductase accessory protein NosL [Geobacillus jurassicus]